MPLAEGACMSPGFRYCPKERPYVTATDCWRKEVDPMKHGTREGQPAGADWDKKWAKMATCECDGSHRKDNQTNWDINRRAFCTALNAEVLPATSTSFSGHFHVLLSSVPRIREM